MNFWIGLLEILKTKMETPEPYGWFHLLSWSIVIVSTVILCTRCRNCKEQTVCTAVFLVAVIVTLLEVYKQTVFSFHLSDGMVTVDYQWYAFPWQFCSMPMYVGLLTGIFRKGRIHEALYAFLATYSVFAGICVMFYPSDVFIDLIGINVQTMFCHGSMIVIGLWLLASGHVKLEHRTIGKAMAVFAVAIGIAVVMNEAAYRTGLTQTETFNMFFISPHCDPSLPVYSLVQQVVPFPWSLLIYFAAFSTAAYIVLMLATGAEKLAQAGQAKDQKVLCK